MRSVVKPVVAAAALAARLLFGAVAAIGAIGAIGASGCTKGAVVSAGAVDAGLPVGVVPAGTRQLERLQYNDVNDMYRLFLAGRANAKEPERVQFLRLAHLSDAELAKGKKPYVKADANGPVAYLGAGFNIGILHGFAEQRADAATGKNVNVITRTEKRWWDPFGGKKLLDGADPYAEPQFLYPPPVSGEQLVVGVGGHGATKEAAAESYRAQFGAMPQAVKLRNEGFQSTVADTPAAAAASGTRIPLDPISALDNRIISTAPGVPVVDHKKNQPPKKKKTK